MIDTVRILVARIAAFFVAFFAAAHARGDARQAAYDATLATYAAQARERADGAALWAAQNDRAWAAYHALTHA